VVRGGGVEMAKLTCTAGQPLPPTTSTIKIHLSSCHCKSYATVKTLDVADRILEKVPPPNYSKRLVIIHVSSFFFDEKLDPDIKARRNKNGSQFPSYSEFPRTSKKLPNKKVYIK
jgi:hypothetical protein